MAHVGHDLEKAAERAEAFNAGRPPVGTVAYWLSKWHTDLTERVRTDDLAERTREDYVADSKPLIAFFGHMEPLEVGPDHLAQYIKLGRNMGRKVRVNRERAAFSSFFTWLIEFKHAGVKFNPCRGVKPSNCVRYPSTCARQSIPPAGQPGTPSLGTTNPPALRNSGHSSVLREEGPPLDATSAVSADFGS